MASTAAAELYIKLTTQGVIETSKTLDGLARATVNAGKEIRTLQTAVGQAQFRRLTQDAAQARTELERLQRVALLGKKTVFLEDTAASLGKIGRVGEMAFGTLTAGITGFVTAGMRGTAEAIQLQQALSQISLHAASVFAPQIHKGIDALQRLAERMRDLSGAQQQGIREWLGGALALSGFVAVLGRVTAGLAAMARARQLAALGQAMGLPAEALGAAGGVGGLLGKAGPMLGIIGGVGVGLLALLTASREGREALSRLFEATRPLLTAIGEVAAGLSQILAPAIKFLADAIVEAMNFISGRGRETAEKLGRGAVQSEEQARAQLAAFKAELAEGPSPARAEKLRDYIGQLEAGLKGAGGAAKETLTPFRPGFEAVTDLYRRIAEAASAETMKSDAAQTAENTKQIVEEIKQIVAAVDILTGNVPLDRPGDP